jgi:transcriptional regulator with XRE-family HTH domain
MDIDNYIFGKTFKLEREIKNLSRRDVGRILCCSELQILQIEEGGGSAFYTESQKWASAKKMAKFLGISEDKAFASGAPEFDVHAMPIIEYKSKPQKIFFLSNASIGISLIGLSLLVGIFYSVYNWGSPDVSLYSKTSPQPNNRYVIKEPVQEVQPISEPPANVAQEKIQPPPLNADLCQMKLRNPISFQPSNASAGPNIVVFYSKSAQKVCLTDGAGKKKEIDITPLEVKVVNALPPLSIAGSQLNQMEIYYQGKKVTNVSAQTDGISFIQVPVQLRKDIVKPVDSVKSPNLNEVDSKKTIQIQESKSEPMPNDQIALDGK